MSKLSSEVLLALAYVSQISDPVAVKSRFVESLNALAGAFTIELAEDPPSGVPEARVLAVATLHSSFGYAVLAERPAVSEADRAVLGNAFRLLAVLLENRMQASALKSKNASLLKEIHLEKSLVRTVLDVLPVGVMVVDDKGTILMGNQAEGSIWGGFRHLGMDRYGEFQARWPDTGKSVEPEEWAVLRALRTGRTVIGQEIDVQGFDGVPKTILNSAAPLRDAEGGIIGAVGINQDITARKRIERDLLDSRHMFTEFMRHSPIYVYIKEVTPTESRVLQASDNYRDMIGVSGGDMVGKTMAELFPAEFAAKISADDWTVVSRGDVLKLAEELNGRHYTTIKFPIRLGDKALLAGYTIDVTEWTRAEESLQALLREKEVMLKEIHHRVKNNMQVISSLLNHQARFSGDPALAEMVRQSQGRIRSMALVHDKLYGSKNLDRIDIGDYIQSLIIHLFQSHQADPGRIRYRLDIPDLSLDINAAVPLGLIVNELISNAIKHAFPDERRGEIVISMAAEEDGWISLMVRDDGPGLAPDFDPDASPSLGLKIVSMLAAQLEGTMAWERSRGTTVRIRFREPRRPPRP